MRGISHKWHSYYSDVENKLRNQGIDITDYYEHVGLIIMMVFLPKNVRSISLIGVRRTTMNDNTVESTLFIDIATSDYGVVHNGILIMDGQDIYRVHQYHIVFEQGTLNITPASDGIVCAYTMTDNEGVTNEIGVLESYDDFIDLFNGCIMIQWLYHDLWGCHSMITRGENKMDTKRNYHSELLEFISDDRVNKESVIHALSDLIVACEEHDELLTKLSNGNGWFADTLARIMDELATKPDPLDESNKLPRIDNDGDQWEWSEFLGYWVLTKPNKVDRPDIVGISPDDPGYCYHYTDFRFDSVHSIDEWCGPVVFAE